MYAPVTLADLVPYETICSLPIRDAQQRLGQAHQSYTLLTRQGKFVHQGIHGSPMAVFASYRSHQLTGEFLSLRTTVWRPIDLPQQIIHAVSLIASIRVGNCRAHEARTDDRFSHVFPYERNNLLDLPLTFTIPSFHIFTSSILKKYIEVISA